MSNNYTIQVLSEAVSPITHLSGTAGNEGIVAREPVQTARGTVMIPFLSGNALRHRCIRHPMAMWLIEQYGLREKISIEQLNFLMHGGNLTKSTASENTKRIAECHTLWPMIRLCGGALPDQMLAGALDVWRGTLVCLETAETLSKSIGNVFPESRMLSSETFLTGYQYTRNDAKKTGIAKVDPETDSESNMMIVSGQAVAKGAMFHHGFLLKHVDPIHLGCLLLSLRLWQQEGGTVGGNARLGHGRLHTTLIDFDDNDEAVQAYVEHAISVKSQAIEWLNDAFLSKSEIRAKGKKVKTGEAKTEEAAATDA